MGTGEVTAIADRERVDTADDSTRADVFRALADRHLDASYRLAQVILGDQAEAEDATHDAFVSAWRNWSTLRDPALFEHWFDRILVNTCRNRLRHRSRHRAGALPADVEVPAADDFGPMHDRGLLRPAMEALVPDQRVVVALRFYRDLTVDQIAARLGIRAGTVKSRLHRGLRGLRNSLDQADPARTLR